MYEFCTYRHRTWAHATKIQVARCASLFPDPPPKHSVSAPPLPAESFAHLRNRHKIICHPQNHVGLTIHLCTYLRIFIRRKEAWAWAGCNQPKSPNPTQPNPTLKVQFLEPRLKTWSSKTTWSGLYFNLQRAAEHVAVGICNALPLKAYESSIYNQIFINVVNFLIYKKICYYIKTFANVCCTEIYMKECTHMPNNCEND